jgi:glycosyltransferase involved in cell wall biosynthesis
MSLCFFITTSSRESANAKQNRALAAELIRRGHRAVLLLDEQRENLHKEDGIPAYTFPSPQPTKPQDALFLRRLIQQHKPDCMIGAFGAVNMMLIMGKLMGVPVRVGWQHTLTMQHRGDQRVGNWKLPFLLARKRMIYRLGTHFVANSQATWRDLVEVYAVPPEKITVLHNSCADPLTNPDADQVLANKDPRKVICLGRLYKMKGQDVLLQAVALLKDDPTLDFTVEFVGEGNLKESLEQLARDLGVADRVTFTGGVKYPEAMQKLTQAAISVMPSRAEAFGFVNVESMATYTPVISTRVDGIAEIVRDGEDGFLVPPDDSAALAEKLKLLLTDGSLRERMGRAGRQHFLEVYEQSKMISTHADWLEKIVSEGRTP